MLGRHARPCESFLVCIEIRRCELRSLFSCLFLEPLFLVWFRGFEWAFPQITLRETWMDVLCIFVIDLVPSNARKTTLIQGFSVRAVAFGGAQRIRDSRI
jgi:hypothetical protein